MPIYDPKLEPSLFDYLKRRRPDGDLYRVRNLLAYQNNDFENVDDMELVNYMQSRYGERQRLVPPPAEKRRPVDPVVQPIRDRVVQEYVSPLDPMAQEPAHQTRPLTSMSNTDSLAQAELPVQIGTGASPYNQDDTSLVRDRVVTTPPPPVTPKRETLADVRRRLQQLGNPDAPDFIPVQNRDKGVWGRVGDILKQGVISAGQNAAQVTNNPKLTAAEKLGYMLGGFGAGAAGGGFRPTLDEERERYFELQRLKEREGQLSEMEKTRLQGLETELKLKKLHQDIVLDQPEQAVDPLTGEPVLVTGKTKLQYNTSRANALSTQEGQNLRQQSQQGFQQQQQERSQKFAQSQQERAQQHSLLLKRLDITNQAERINVENRFDAIKQNARRTDDYVQREHKRALDLAKAVGETGAGAEEARGYAAIVQERAGYISQLAQVVHSSVDPDEVSSAQKELARTMKEISDARDKVVKSAGKVVHNRPAMDILMQGERPPEIITAPIYSPVLPQTKGKGRTVPRSKDPLGLFR